MKDPISFLAAAAGGFMLSLAISSIINAAPIASLKAPTRVETLHVTSLHQSSASSKNSTIPIKAGSIFLELF